MNCLDRTFSVVLGELRKEKGISQKAAADGLGISQALLSHYERGIRECSLDFLTRAADYYGVTCDYLLGRSRSRTGFNEGFNAEAAIAGDRELSPLTLFRACAAVREALDADGAAALDEYNALTLSYFLLCRQKQGALPREWELPGIGKADEFERGLMLLAAKSISSAESKVRGGDRAEPECVKTLCRECARLVKEETGKKRH